VDQEALVAKIEADNTEKFLGNVREAREDGFDLVCATCGVGMTDTDDERHDDWFECSPGHEQFLAMAQEWAAKQKAKGALNE
jgi:hypothetical protein